MEQQKKWITENDFQELCRNVCKRLTPSNYRDVDREALYFAIYWRVCDLLGEKIFFPRFPVFSRISVFRREIQLLLNSRQMHECESFDAGPIVDQNVEKAIGRFYGANEFTPDERKTAVERRLILAAAAPDAGGRLNDIGQVKSALSRCGRFESVRFDTPESLN